MTQRPTDVSIRLQFVRGDIGEKRWLALRIEAGEAALVMVPNSAAARSVITPATYERLRPAGVVGETIIRLRGRTRHAVVAPLAVASEPLGAFEFEVREIAQMRSPSGRYAIDGYLGLDFFLAFFDAMRFEFRTRMLTLELRKSEVR